MALPGTIQNGAGSGGAKSYLRGWCPQGRGVQVPPPTRNNPNAQGCRDLFAFLIAVIAKMHARSAVHELTLCVSDVAKTAVSPPEDPPRHLAKKRTAGSALLDEVGTSNMKDGIRLARAFEQKLDERIQRARQSAKSMLHVTCGAKSAGRPRQFKNRIGRDTEAKNVLSICRHPR